MRSGKSSKYEENEYKSSLGCLRQKPIGALNSVRIGGNVKPEFLKKNSLKLVRSGGQIRDQAQQGQFQSF